MTALQLSSPLAGWATPLAEVPDAAFSEGFVGDGIAVDPTESVLRAPCDGVVAAIHRARHACTVRAANGVEILLHIGVDTVMLEGEGFVAHVAAGTTVRTGDPLITFDMDVIAKRAKSLLTMMVIANGENGHAVSDRRVDMEVVAGEPVMTVEGGLADAGPVVVPVSTEMISREVRLSIATGLHARPAAKLAALARGHDGVVAVACRGREADAKSVVALLGLGAISGDVLTIAVSGPGAEAAVEDLVAAVTAGLGDPVVEAPSASAGVSAAEATASVVVAETTPFVEGREVEISGVNAVPGVAVGPAVRLFHTETTFPENGVGVEIEAERSRRALATLIDRLDAASRTGEAAAIFRAHREIVDDPDLAEGADALIRAGRSAERAWSETLSKAADTIAALSDPRLAERAADLRDIRSRILGLLTGADAGAVLSNFPEGGVLVADEVLPSELAVVPSGRLAGICMVGGGATSHAVIIASSMGVPTIVAAGSDAGRVPEGAPVIVDNGKLTVFASPARQARTRGEVATRARVREENRRSAGETCFTADGARIEIFANLGKVEDAARAREEGAEGCGLLRTEFLFLGRIEAPSEDEQCERYQSIADAMDGRPVIIRTLDAGGDKPLAYFHIPREENPALGVRGVRACLREPGLLRSQIRAILRVRPFGVAKIMVPMVTSVRELRAVKAMVEEERAALGRAEPIEVGVMIEVPAAALTADKLAAEAAFFSIGTNDLTQYVLAMDRGNSALAPEVDTLHPGVLRLIGQVAAGAAEFGRPVAVCGGSASDPSAVPLLVGLGVTELSATPAMIAELKALVRSSTVAECRSLAEAALEADSAEEVRALVRTRNTAVG